MFLQKLSFTHNIFKIIQYKNHKIVKIERLVPDLAKTPKNTGKQDEQMSVAEAVRTIVSNNLSLLNCLREGVVNYTWLSEKIKDDVARLTGRKKINIDAIKAALIRFQEELEKEYELQQQAVARVLYRSTVELQNDITLITVKKSLIEKLFKEIFDVASEARFFNLTQGKKTYTIVISSEDVPQLFEKIDPKSVLDRVDNQSAIVLISPYDIMTTPGFISYLTRILYTGGINITQVISCYTDTILILDNKQSVKALEIIQKSIEYSRRIMGTA